MLLSSPRWIRAEFKGAPGTGLLSRREARLFVRLNLYPLRLQYGVSDAGDDRLEASHGFPSQSGSGRVYISGPFPPRLPSIVTKRF